MVTNGGAQDWQACARANAVGGEGLPCRQVDCALLSVQVKSQGLRLGLQDWQQVVESGPRACQVSVIQEPDRPDLQHRVKPASEHGNGYGEKQRPARVSLLNPLAAW